MQPQELPGGVANAGKVTRVGDHVLRPSHPHSGSVHAFLRALRAAGFDGASLPLGIDEDGRERLVFIPGDVPLPPYPDWARSDAALVSVAVLLREFHAASATFDPAGRTWNAGLADPAGGSVVCHDDVCLENVVFRDGVAVGLLDFDFAAPGRPIYDLAQFARMCVPIDDDENSAAVGWPPGDRLARLRLVADTYGLDGAGRALLVECLAVSIRRAGDFLRGRFEAGDPNFVAMANRLGGTARLERRDRWWAEHEARVAAALR